MDILWIFPQLALCANFTQGYALHFTCNANFTSPKGETSRLHKAWLYARRSAISIIAVKDFCLSSDVVISSG